MIRLWHRILCRLNWHSFRMVNREVVCKWCGINIFEDGGPI